MFLDFIELAYIQAEVLSASKHRERLSMPIKRAVCIVFKRRSCTTTEKINDGIHDCVFLQVYIRISKEFSCTCKFRYVRDYYFLLPDSVIRSVCNREMCNVVTAAMVQMSVRKSHVIRRATFSYTNPSTLAHYRSLRYFDWSIACFLW
jgi:hypothetical protein